MHGCRFALLLIGSLVCLASGCVRYEASLDLTSTTDENRKFVAHFSQAYIDRDDAGDYVVVLLNDPIDQVKAGGADKAIDPVAVPPLRQIMTIRVLWRPMKGAKFDHPLATNATVHWYVFDRTAQSSGFLHYTGNAFADVYTERDRASIEIRNATLKLSEKSGDMADPVGPVHMTGSFDCLSDERRVKNLLAEVKDRTLSSTTAPTVPAGPVAPSAPLDMPPSRTPSQP
jgi:hypothetical protein